LFFLPQPSIHPGLSHIPSASPHNKTSCAQRAAALARPGRPRQNISTVCGCLRPSAANPIFELPKKPNLLPQTDADPRGQGLFFSPVDLTGEKLPACGAGLFFLPQPSVHPGLSHMPIIPPHDKTSCAQRAELWLWQRRRSQKALRLPAVVFCEGWSAWVRVGLWLIEII
jgi:hypothetical protein